MMAGRFVHAMHAFHTYAEWDPRHYLRARIADRGGMARGVHELAARRSARQRRLAEACLTCANRTGESAPRWSRSGWVTSRDEATAPPGLAQSTRRPEVRVVLHRAADLHHRLDDGADRGHLRRPRPLRLGERARCRPRRPQHSHDRLHAHRWRRGRPVLPIRRHAALAPALCGDPGHGCRPPPHRNSRDLDDRGARGAQRHRRGLHVPRHVRCGPAGRAAQPHPAGQRSARVHPQRSRHDRARHRRRTRGHRRVRLGRGHRRADLAGGGRMHGAGQTAGRDDPSRGRREADDVARPGRRVVGVHVVHLGVGGRRRVRAHERYPGRRLEHPRTRHREGHDRDPGMGLGAQRIRCRATS